MPEIPVTVNAAGQRWSVLVEAETPEQAIADVWAAIRSERSVVALGEYGTGRQQVFWNPAHVTHVTAVPSSAGGDASPLRRMPATA